MAKSETIRLVIGELERTYSALARSPHIRAPDWDSKKNAFRHTTQDDCLLIFLKGVRSVSLLNASAVLLDAGHIHEVGILCRCMDEAFEDILMFMRNLGQNGLANPAQRQVLEEFFQEQFDDTFSPWSSANNRARVPRKKVRATISCLPENPVNPSDYQKTAKLIYDCFGGYVHGAYPHIMELFEGNSENFQMTGVRDPRPINDWKRQLLHYSYRSILVARFVAKRLGMDAVANHMCEVQGKIEQEYPQLLDDPNAILQKIKKKGRRR